MEKIIVFQFEYFDRNTGQMTRSEEWATAAAIAEIGAKRIEDSATEIDASLVHNARQ